MIRLAIVAVLLLGACGESQTPPETPQPTVETPPAPTADPTLRAIGRAYITQLPLGIVEGFRAVRNDVPSR